MRVWPLVLVIALVVAAAGRGLRAGATEGFLAARSYEDVYYVPPADWLPVLSFGYDEALADLLWTRALVYYGDELVNRGGARHALSYADAILRLDPWFTRVYHWAGMAGMYAAQATTVDDIRASIAFLERGARVFPDDGDMAWDLGASLAYELAPLVDDPKEKRRIRKRAVQYMQVAARLGSGPDWLVLANAAQLRRLGRTQQAIRHLEEMYAVVSDPGVRRRIESQLAELRSRAYAEAFRRAQQQFEERRMREYPWVPPGLYIYIMEPTRSDPDAWLRGQWLPARNQLGGPGASDGGP